VFGFAVLTVRHWAALGMAGGGGTEYGGEETGRQDVLLESSGVTHGAMQRKPTVLASEG
jgi:hypothetical protein